MKTDFRGIAYLVGAGPGDPGLLTLRAQTLLQSAEVLIYDYLCNPEILRWAPASAERIYAGKKSNHHTLTQDEINALLVTKVKEGKRVVRLKGGDPYLFGRGGEEAQALHAVGLPFEVVPGVTSAMAAPAYAGIPVTHRDFASTVTFITGHEDPNKNESSLDWEALARLSGTKVFLMGVERLAAISASLLAHGADPETPAALVRWGTWGHQQSMEATLGTIAEKAKAASFKPPAVFVIGNVIRARAELNWFERRPLFGKRVVVTRTRTQASQLSERLREAGADVIEIPTIRTVERPLENDQEKRLQHLADSFDWIIFTSPNAVPIFFSHFLKVHGDLRALGPLRIASVGPGTSECIRKFHLKIDLQPETFTTSALAQALASLPEKRFCLPRAAVANPIIPETLRSRGAEVWDWPLYETVPETEDPTGSRKRFETEGADWILFTSSSTVEHWKALNLQTEGRAPAYASIGPVTSETMKQLSYPISFEANPHTIPGLVDTLLHQF